VGWCTNPQASSRWARRFGSAWIQCGRPDPAQIVCVRASRGRSDHSIHAVGAQPKAAMAIAPDVVWGFVVTAPTAHGQDGSPILLVRVTRKIRPFARNGERPRGHPALPRPRRGSDARGALAFQAVVTSRLQR
jgi:hypothetical protein